MKHPLFLVAALVLAFLSISSARAQSVRIGYGNGQDAESSYSSTLSDADVSAAVYFPAELLARYAGCELSGARAMLSSRLNISEMEIWVRFEPAGEDICKGRLTRDSDPALAKGWNTVEYDNPYIIPETPEEGLYVGVTYHQTGAAMGIASLGYGSPCAGYVMPPNGEWEDRSEDFTFFIEGILSGDRLPKNNLHLENAIFSPYFVLDQGTYSIAGTVRNVGADTVTDFDISLLMDGAETPFAAHFDCGIPYGETYDFSCCFEPELEFKEGQHGVTLCVTKVNEAEDSDPSDNSIDGLFRIVPFDMSRRVLVEEFTTELCSNCPRVAGWMHELLEQPAYRDVMVPVCHHAGFGTDIFTIPSDEEYVWFYDPQYVYAPAVMVDRLRSSNGVPPFNPAGREALAEFIDMAAAMPAEVSVSLHAEINGEMLKATVRGAKGVDTLCDDPRLVCVVTEDNVPARKQAGIESGSEYFQQHVSRAVNATWGIPVPFEGDTYEYEVELPLDHVSDMRNINLVGYIFNYDPASRNSCIVKNASILPYSGMTLSVPSVEESDETGPEIWFTISGTRLSGRPDTPGVYILRHGTRTHKVLI